VFTPPGGPDQCLVLATVTHEPDFVKRAHISADALDSITSSLYFSTF
jgi:hypothetical protein